MATAGILGRREAQRLERCHVRQLYRVQRCRTLTVRLCVSILHAAADGLSTPSMNKVCRAGKSLAESLASLVSFPEEDSTDGTDEDAA
jgi:hypothetical protein